MDGLIVKRKVAVAKPTVTTPATSRPSSRNSTRVSSRPASPTKSTISTNSLLTSPPTTTTSANVIRPKAKVNSSAIRRSQSSTQQHETPIRPSSPTKSIRSRDGALSPHMTTNTVGAGTRKSIVRVKASSSVSSTTSTPSPTTTGLMLKELRARSLTASSDTLRPNNTVSESRKRQGSAAALLHHTSSLSSLQPPPASPLSSTCPATAWPSSSDLGDENVPTHPVKIRSKVSVLAKSLNDASNTPTSTALTPEHPAPSIQPPNTRRPGTTRARTGSISSNVSFTTNNNTAAAAVARTSSPAPTSPPLPTISNTPQHQHRRSSSSHSHPTTPVSAYPITTTVPAANPHRYSSIAAATVSRASPAASGLRSSFSSPSSPSPKHIHATDRDEFKPFAKTSVYPPSPSLNGGTGGFPYGSVGRAAGSLNALNADLNSNVYHQAYVDLTNVPLPPQSPPISSLSVSSRSSVSKNRHVRHDSGNTTSPESSVVSSSRGVGGGATNSDSTDGVEGADESVDEEKKVRAEAKSNRKIEDLEIINRSLLAMYASSEKTKDRQAKEIRELKRKLRESRLVLPHRTYRAVKSSLDPDEVGDDEEDVTSSSDDDEFHSADEGIGDEGKGKGKGRSDETYKRIKIMLENLLETGRQALDKTKEDFMDVKGGTKVLTAEEVESWRDSEGVGIIGRLSDLDTMDDNDDEDGDEDDVGDVEDSNRLIRSNSPTPQPVTRNGSMIGFGGLRRKPPGFGSSTPVSSPKPPPILITESS